MKKCFKKISVFFLAIVLCFSIFVMFEMPSKIYGGVDESDYLDEFLVSYMEPDGIDPYGKSYTSTVTATPLTDVGGKELTNGVFGITPSQWNGSCCSYNDDVSIVIDMEN